MKSILSKQTFACILTGCGIIPFTLLGSNTSPSTSTKKKESSIVVTTQTNLAAQQFSVTVKPVPAEGLVLNLEAPWKLAVVSSEGVTPAQSKLGLDDLKNSKGIWELKGTIVRKSDRREIKIKADVFVCTKDKKTCYRNVHEESIKI